MSAPRAVPPRRIRVLLVGPSLDILGGQAVALTRLQAGLRSLDALDVQFLAVNPRLPGPLALLQRVKYVRTVVTMLAYLARLVVRVPRADVVHAFSASYWSFLLAPVPAMLVARLAGRRVVLNYRSGEAPHHLATSRVAVPLMRLAHAIVVPSGFLVDVFARFGLQARAIPNFVDADAHAAPSRDDGAARSPVVLSNRNFEPLYDVACTLRAFARVQARHADASLVLVGSGSQERALRALADSLGLRHVRWEGRVAPARMAGYYASADVYVSTPNIDNMPNSVLEAWAAGTPVVSSDAGGVPYIVRDGENGLLAPVGDDAAVADRLLRVLEDRALARRLAEAGRREIAERYTWDAVAPAWEALYRSISGVGTGDTLPSGELAVSAGQGRHAP